MRSDGEVILATRRGDAAALTRALDQGAEVDAPGTYRGRTALHLAVMKSDVTLLDLLVSRGANPSALDDIGLHALGMAVVAKAPLGLMDSLAEKGLDVRLPNGDGFTALHAAAEVDNPAAVPWLIAHGAQLEGRTKRGHTALHIACALGHSAAAKALLEAGADRVASSPTGTPAEVARAESKPELVRLIEGWK